MPVLHCTVHCNFFPTMFTGISCVSFGTKVSKNRMKNISWNAYLWPYLSWSLNKICIGKWPSINDVGNWEKCGEGSKIGQNCQQIVLKNCRHEWGGVKNLEKIANIVYGWSLRKIVQEFWPEWVKIASVKSAGANFFLIHCPNVSTTTITSMGCWQCLPLSVVQLTGKHCGKPHCCNGVVTCRYVQAVTNTDYRCPERK